MRFPNYVESSDEAKDFILKALVKDPKQRATMLDLYLHPFVKGSYEMLYIP